MIETQLSERQKALIANWLRRKHLPPLGYTFDRTRTYFVLDPEVAPLIRQAFERVLEGIMPVEVLRRLNEELGFRTPLRGVTGGKPLARGAFYRILHDPFYTGRIRSRFGIVAGEHEAIVCEGEYSQVQELLGTRGRRPQRFE